jgi:hypothetical protein
VTIREEGTITAVVFDRQVLSEAIAQGNVPKYAGDPVVATNLDSLSFAPKGEFKPATSDSIVFSMAGSATFEWLYDGDLLKGALAGASRADIPAALQQFPMIGRHIPAAILVEAIPGIDRKDKDREGGVISPSFPRRRETRYHRLVIQNYGGFSLYIVASLDISGSLDPRLRGDDGGDRGLRV